MKLHELPTPCYVVDYKKLRQNLEILKEVSQKTGARILLAQKAFSMFDAYPLIGEYLNGCTSSGLYEAKLGMEEMGKENHIFSPAYRQEEFEEICQLCDHIIFNSMDQLKRFGQTAKKFNRGIGLRINPECSTQEGHEIYDPCARGSRLGITIENFKIQAENKELLSLVDGLHFHTLCEQDADALKITLDAVEEKFGPWMKQMKWINFGGGHHITRVGYNRSLLESCIRHIQETYDVQVYLEPGEAVALNAGYLVTKVLDVIQNEIQIAVLDTSAACHMPDVLEMPYRPPLADSGESGEKAFTYRLAGPTCLAGDIIGEYSFSKKLVPGDMLIFQDMAIYSMVKNNTFNGMPLPSIAVQDEKQECRIIRKFEYEDFKMRLS